MVGLCGKNRGIDAPGRLSLACPVQLERALEVR
jgi:hypothetical protein